MIFFPITGIILSAAAIVASLILAGGARDWGDIVLGAIFTIAGVGFLIVNWSNLEGMM